MRRTHATGMVLLSHGGPAEAKPQRVRYGRRCVCLDRVAVAGELLRPLRTRRFADDDGARHGAFSAVPLGAGAMHTSSGWVSVPRHLLAGGCTLQVTVHVGNDVSTEIP